MKIFKQSTESVLSNLWLPPTHCREHMYKGSVMPVDIVAICGILSVSTE
jgi:hypothetical protein